MLSDPAKSQDPRGSPADQQREPGVSGLRLGLPSARKRRQNAFVRRSLVKIRNLNSSD